MYQREHKCNATFMLLCNHQLNFRTKTTVSVYSLWKPEGLTDNRIMALLSSGMNSFQGK